MSAVQRSRNFEFTPEENFFSTGYTSFENDGNSVNRQQQQRSFLTSMAAQFGTPAGGNAKPIGTRNIDLSLAKPAQTKRVGDTKAAKAKVCFSVI